MMCELLSPGVENRKEADFRAEVFGVACDRQQSFRGGAKEQGHTERPIDLYVL